MITCEELAARIQKLQPDAMPRDVARLCLLLSNYVERIEDLCDDDRLAAAWREMGIRLALGTTPGRLRATLLRQSSWTIALGAVAGLAMAIGLGRYLQSLVHGAGSAIVATSAFAVVVTAAVAAVATWSATRHIARLDVGEVIRAECAD